MTSLKPNIYNFLSAVSYLSDYFKYRKQLDNKFSFDSWAQELGFQSRSYLRMVMIGKKSITPRFIEAFVQSAKLDKMTAKYFEILVNYSQAKSHQERESFGASLLKLIKSNVMQESISDHVDFVAQPFYPRLLVLLSFEDIVRDKKTLATLIDASEAEVEKGLQVLASLDLIEKINSTDWRSKKTLFKVPDNIGSVTLAHFHEKSLHDALKAFTLPKEVRKFQSFLLPMDKGELESFHTLLEAFSAELISKYRSNIYQDRRVFQVNFNIFPVSQPLTAQTLEVSV